MKFLVAFPLFGACFATEAPPNPMNKIPGLSDAPECKALLDLGESAWVVPNCDAEVQACIKEVHSMIAKCAAKHYKYLKDNNTEVYECINKPEMEALKKQGFRLSCQWHTAMIKCLEGKEVDDTIEQLEDVQITDEEHKENKEFIMNHIKKVSEKVGAGIDNCVEEWKTKMKECKEKVKSCPNYSACSGEGPLDDQASDVIKTWNTISSRLAKQKMKETRDNINKAADCLKIAGIEQ